MAAKKKKASAKRAGGNRRGKSAAPKRSRSSSVAKQIADHDRARRVIGEKNLRRGPMTIAQTRRLTPTRAGIAALGRAVLAVQRSQGTKGLQKHVYTFDIEVRYKGPDGKYRTKTIERAGFPLNKAVSKWLKKRPTGQHTGKGAKPLTRAAAFRDLVQAQVISASKRAVEGDTFDEKRYQAFKATIENASEAQAKAKLKRFKAQRDLTFKVTIHREGSSDASRTTGGRRRPQSKAKASKRPQSNARTRAKGVSRGNGVRPRRNRGQDRKGKASRSRPR